MRTLAAVLLLTLAACSTLACSKPQPPEKERPVEPQAAQHTQLRDAMQAPIDQAKAVEADVQEAADAQREAIDVAGG